MATKRRNDATGGTAGAPRGGGGRGARDAPGRVPVPADLDRLAWLLDSSIRLPGGYRIGVDGLIGLIPGIGDAIGALLSLYIVLRASSFDIPKAVLARMLMNVGVETLVGAVPVFGDLFDFAFKANQRNVSLLRRYAAAPRRERRVAWALLAGVVVLAVVLLVLVVAIGVALAQWLVAAV